MSVFLGGKNNRPRAIAPQNAAGAVFPVKCPGHYFRCYNENVLTKSGFQVLLGHVQSEDESRTCGRYIESESVRCIKFGLEPVGGGRAMRIRSYGRNNNDLDVLNGHPGRFQGISACVRRQVRAGLAAVGDPPFRHPRSFHNPLVAGIQGFLQVVIGEDSFRNIRSRSSYRDVRCIASGISACLLIHQICSPLRQSKYAAVRACSCRPEFIRSPVNDYRSKYL
jgi:hypothetical protein